MSMDTELERERMRLAACGVVAMADTPESAARARDMREEYRSASCDDVARRVDECMALRAERDALAALDGWHKAKDAASARPVPAEPVNARLLDVSTGKLEHINAGLCPDSINGPDSRDPACPACRAIAEADADSKLACALQGTHGAGRETEWVKEQIHRQAESDVLNDLLGSLREVCETFSSTNRLWKDTAVHAMAQRSIARAEAALASSDDTQPGAEERRLRRMLCRQRHGVSAYMDDGEATFGGDEFQRPTDYLRESLDSIEQAWIEAGRKQVAQAEPQPDAGLIARDDVIQMAREAGVVPASPFLSVRPADLDAIERFAALVLEADDGPWKAAVIDQLIIAHTLTAEHESDPLKAIQDLLAYNSDIAVDPRVSGAAAKLVERTKEACAKACMGEARKWPYPSHGNAAASMCAKMIFDMRQK